ncbi:MAG: diacylglycerol kinase [Methylococcales bacterium]
MDIIATEHHELAKIAKDLGPASVMLLIFMAIATWLIILI